MESRQPDWSRVKDILQVLLDSPVGERTRLARQACGDDAGLLAEVESLLDAHERAGRFAERPALQLLAESSDPRDTSSPPSPLLQPGDRLGPYEIQACLGIGGMGEVYKAADVRLQRVVAIKILRSQGAEPEHRVQFEREARVIAKLGHPQICVLHDIGSEGPLAYLVMEYLDGETLAERLARGMLPFDEAIHYACEIVAALRETHRHGIVHRDIKPSNIMLTSKGAKLLDFGVAKHFMMAALASDADATGTLNATSLSSFFGTPLYMAPEQLRGGSVDHRADIFAFGAVLYEMITGRKAFHGDSFLSAVIAVREDQPPSLSTDSPRLETLNDVIRRCLAKDPAARWQSADDLDRALSEVMATGSGDAHVPATHGRQRRRLMWSVAALVALAAAFTMWPRPERATQTASVSNAAQPRLVLQNVRMLTGDERIEIDPAFSPDGHSVAYAGGAISGVQIMVKPIDGGPARPLIRGGMFESQPRWSHDGTQLLYIGTGGLFAASSAGGDARRILAQSVFTEPVDLIDLLNGFSAAAWSPDGQTVAVVENSDKVLTIVSLSDSRRRTLTTFDAQVHSCDWSPNGRWLACTSGNWVSAAPGTILGNAAPSTIILIDPNDGTVREITDRLSSNQSPAWAPDSQSLYFVSNRSGPYDIYAAAIGADGTLLGAPAQLTTGLGAYAIDFSNDGKRLAYAAYSARTNIWSIPIPSDGVVADGSAARQVTTGNQVIESMRVSRDGKWLLYDSNLTGNFEIYRVPVDGGTSERLTTAPSEEFGPDLSADGRYLAYFSWRTKSRDVFVQPLDGRPVEQVTSTPSHEAYPVWSPDGRTLVFWDNADEGGAFRGVFSTRRDATGRWAPPTLLRAGAVKPSWSPDGRFIVYTRVGGIEALALDSGQHRVIYSKTNGIGAEEALLSEDGKTVYFKTHDDDAEQRAQFYAVPMDGGPARRLVHFTDPARRSNRTDFAVGAGRLYFGIDERRSNIWLADVTERMSR